MARKRDIIYKENATKLLFKNSHKSINTYSKTYSDASRFCTKSLVLQLKQKLPKTKFYEDQGTLKRDLSIETDICILRRYYKKNRNKLLSRGDVSSKSKYSINHTEIDTINEFTRDSSACGDSELTNNQENLTYNINITSLVINNLKKLLNDWIKKYLLENDKTKQKIDSVLDSILHKLDLQKDDTSSCTYTVDVELEDQTSKLGSRSTLSKNLLLKHEEELEELTKQKSSYLTIPLSNKYLKVISTLSIPRKQQKQYKSKSLHKIKKFRHKKILLSISKSSKCLLTSSSLDFLTLRAKSLTKRCATYQKNKREIVDCPNTVFMQKSYYNNNIVDNYSISDKTLIPKNIQDTNVRKENLKRIPSIYKNIYGTNPTNMISYESANSERKTCCNSIIDDQGINIRQYPTNNINQNQKIINEHEQSDQLVTIDFAKRSDDTSLLDIKSQNKLKRDKLKTSKIKKTETRYGKKNLFHRKISRLQTYKSIKSKQFKYLFRKSNDKIQSEKELLNHFKSILKYFSNYEQKNDIQLHIQVNVCPITSSEANTTTKLCTNLEDLNVRDIEIKEKDIKKTTPSNSQNIISLLDGATSQSKYIVSRETSTNLLKETIKKPTKLLDSPVDNRKIAEEISELRVIIKSLATTAEKLISDHIYESAYVKSESRECKNNFQNVQQPIEKSLFDSAVAKKSKGNQISNDVKRSQIKSGFKLRKEPKNKIYTPRLTKKSTSYNIIASESILKITDMTSAAQNMTYEKMDEALTCSLPKSKSLFEIAIGPNKRKLLAFYCDDFVRPEEYAYNVCNRNTPCTSNQRRECPHHIKPNCVHSKCNHYGSCNDDTCPEEPTLTCTEFIPVNDVCDLIDDDNSCSSVCIDIDPKSCTNKVTIRNRAGVGFWEGCLYCALLWIPVMIISWLFYIYVLKDSVTPSDKIYRGIEYKINKGINNNDGIGIETMRQPQVRLIRPPHASNVQSLTLSDLGF